MKSKNRRGLKWFYGQLASLPSKGWKVELVGVHSEIRLKSPKGKKFCYRPITAVCMDACGRRFHGLQFARAARAMGLMLNEDDLRSVACAADWKQGYPRRSSLLRALKLKETA